VRKVIAEDKSRRTPKDLEELKRFVARPTFKRQEETLKQDSKKHLLELEEELQ